MLKTVSIALSLLLVSEFAAAAQIRMTCRNPFRSYEAVFDDKAKTFRLLSPGKNIQYQVRRVQKHPNGHVVSGRTVRGGPSFIAYLGRNRRIEFIDKGKVFQIDKCK